MDTIKVEVLTNAQVITETVPKREPMFAQTIETMSDNMIELMSEPSQEPMLE